MAVRSLVSLLLVALFAGVASADVRLPNVIGSNMVLQRGMAVPIWGKADPHEDVTVSFAGQTKTVKADDSGKWLIRLAPLNVSKEPQVMIVSGKSTITLENVLVGDVWVCAGQSNMEFPLSQAAGGDKEVASVECPQIRLLHVPEVASLEPAKDTHANWVPCDHRTAGSFSAVGYFYGQKLHRELGVPVGLIECAWSETRIMPWTWPRELVAWPWGKAAVDKLGQDVKAHGQATTHAASALPATQQDPGAIYNGMVAPLLPYAIRGVIWYQGEENNDDGILYREKMQALIVGWRRAWKQGDFPFLYVQLAPFRYVYHNPENPPQIWEAQLTCLSIPQTGMAVTTDLVQDVQNIHPPDQLHVGSRLVLWALAKVYDHRNLVYSGPLYKSMEIEGGSIRLKFDSVGKGLTSRDGKPLSCFEIAGVDKKFLPAQGRIEGDTVVVWCEQVTAPVAVRLGGTDTDRPNLINRDGLPASPFRTDQVWAEIDKVIAANDVGQK